MKKKYLLLVLLITIGALPVQSQEKEKIAQGSTVKAYIKKDTPNVPADKILDTIIAEQKGKVVLVDLWATWCGPCLAGMKKMKTIKPQILDKGVVIVYLTDENSPISDWEAKLSDIGGIHYRLTKDQFEALKVKYEFKGIPTYMIFDKAGNKTLQKSGYPGNDKMIEELSLVW